jgi:hypothetical protein
MACLGRAKAQGDDSRPAGPLPPRLVPRHCHLVSSPATATSSLPAPFFRHPLLHPFPSPRRHLGLSTLDATTLTRLRAAAAIAAAAAALSSPPPSPSPPPQDTAAAPPLTAPAPPPPAILHMRPAARRPHVRVAASCDTETGRRGAVGAASARDPGDCLSESARGSAGLTRIAGRAARSCLEAVPGLQPAARPAPHSEPRRRPAQCR